MPVWQVNVASVVKDNAQFVHALTRVPDPKMQIWHYRLLTGADSEKWCGWEERGMSEGGDQQRKKVLSQISSETWNNIHLKNLKNYAHTHTIEQNHSSEVHFIGQGVFETFWNHEIEFVRADRFHLSLFGALHFSFDHLCSGWSRRPKVLDDLVGDAEALKFIVDHLLVSWQIDWRKGIP